MKDSRMAFLMDFQMEIHYVPLKAYLMVVKMVRLMVLTKEHLMVLKMAHLMDFLMVQMMAQYLEDGKAHQMAHMKVMKMVH